MFDIKFPHAYGEVTLSGKLKLLAEDFIVDEELSFEPTGEGEHLLLHVRKRDQNTNWVAKEIARHLNIESFEVGYAGLKDRRAVTTQWFSVPNVAYVENETKLNKLWCDDIQCLEMIRHQRKIRRGDITFNHFKIRLKELEGDLVGLEEKIKNVFKNGIPNYFGEQRFGKQRNNLIEVDTVLFARKRVPQFTKSILMSAARSWLFNLVLAERIRKDNWNKTIEGDITEQVNEREISTGPMWGRGRLKTTDAALELETNAITEFKEWQSKLEYLGLKQERRALIIYPANTSFELNVAAQELQLNFSLTKGCYATSVIREILNVS